MRDRTIRKGCKGRNSRKGRVNLRRTNRLTLKGGKPTHRSISLKKGSQKLTTYINSLLGPGTDPNLVEIVNGLFNMLKKISKVTTSGARGVIDIAYLLMFYISYNFLKMLNYVKSIIKFISGNGKNFKDSVMFNIIGSYIKFIKNKDFIDYKDLYSFILKENPHKNKKSLKHILYNSV